MSEYYFLYRPIRVGNMGGVLPTRYDKNTITLGLGEREGYYLGKTVDPASVEDIKEFFIRFITEEEARGFQLLGVNKIREESPDNPEGTERDLTEEEQQAQNKAYNLILKLKLRSKINSRIGDTEEIIADLTKRIELLERLLLRVMYYQLSGQEIPEELKQSYLPLIQAYVQSVDNGNFKSRIDVEDVHEVFGRLTVRFNEITNIVKEEYLDKKL